MANKNVMYDSDILYFLVEGPTEENYIGHLNMVCGKNYQLDIVSKSKLKTDIFEDIRRICGEKGIDEEELFLIYDLEQCPNEKSKFIESGKLKHPNTYLTQPSMEYHFIHHFIDPISTTVLSANDALLQLLVHIPEYKKGSTMDWVKVGLDMDRIKYARDKAIDGFSNYDQDKFSTLGQLIDQYFILYVTLCIIVNFHFFDKNEIYRTRSKSKIFLKTCVDAS